MDCQCPIWMYGRTSKGLYPRQSTGLTDMAEAEALRASLDADAKSEKVHGPKIADSIENHLASRKHLWVEKTYGHHRLVLDTFKDYCQKSRGVLHARAYG